MFDDKMTVQITLIVCSVGIGELDDFSDLPLLPNGKVNRSAGSKRERGVSSMNQLDSFDNGSVSKYVSPGKPTPGKSGSVVPSPGKKKREEGWKEVMRK